MLPVICYVRSHTNLYATDHASYDLYYHVIVIVSFLSEYRLPYEVTP